MRKIHRGIRNLLLAVMLSLVAAAPALAAAADSGGASGTLKTVGLSGNASVQIKDVLLLPSDKQTIVAFTAYWYNGGSSNLDLSDYYLKVSTGTGAAVQAQPLPQDVTDQPIGAKSGITYRYYAKVASGTKLGNVSIQVMKWEFSAANFEQRIAAISVPSGYSPAVPSGQSKTLVLNDNRFGVKVKDSGVSSNADYVFPFVTLEVTNNDYASLQVPAEKYAILTKSGYLYPLDAQDSGNQTLRPKESADVSLSGSIPKSDADMPWQLVVIESVKLSDTSTIDYPAATFAVSATAAAHQSSGSTYTYTNPDGTYTVALNGTYRVPWQDDDLLIADVTVTNKSKQSIPALTLGGSFTLDQRVAVSGTPVMLDKIISLQPGDAEHVRLIGKIPYTNKFADYTVRLKDATRSTDIVQFDNLSKISAIPVLSEQGTVTYDEVGRQYTLKAIDSSLYEGTGSDIYLVSLELTNQEKRVTDSPVLSGHFVAADGTVYPAEMETVTDRSRPGGKAIAQAWTSIPKGFDTTGMKLIVGEAVTGSAFSTATDKPDGYLNANSLALPAVAASKSDNLDQLVLNPYTLSLSNVPSPGFMYDKNTNIYNIILQFDYTMSQDFMTEANNADHQLLLEWEDNQGKVVGSKSYPLDGSSEALELGSHTVKFMQSVEGLSIDGNSYTLKVYDQFKSGYKKLLASEKLD